MKLLIPTASALVLLAVLGAASATTRTVLPDGSGDYPTIEAAIEASVDGDIVELANGTFRGAGNRDIWIQEVTITIRSESGDPAGCIIDCEGSVAEPHHGFEFNSDVLLEGVTFCNGYAEWGSGAVWVGSDAIVRNCVFRNNDSNWFGAAMGCQFSPTFDHCWFIENHGLGAVWVGGQYSSPRFEHCSFVNNAGVACETGAGNGAEFSDCVLSGGSLGGYGAVVSGVMSDVDMVRCTVLSFDQPPYDGVISAGGHIAIKNSIIALNRAQDTMDCSPTQITLTCSDVYGNAGGDWTGCIAGQLGVDGNICLDPQFCSENPSEDENWSLQSDSPCAPEQSGCGLIGALDVGCGTTEAEERTWGGVKLLFHK